MSEFTAAPIGCLIMAAGNASRFGENKLTASFAGKSLFSLALAAIPADTFARVTVVSQYPALLQEAEQAGFHAIRNDRPDDGISRTIRLGTEAMADCAGILYMVADQPLLRQETVLRIVQDWRQHRAASSARPTTAIAATPACSRRGFSRSCARSRATAAAPPSSAGTKTPSASSKPPSPSSPTATPNRPWKS